MLVRTFQIKRDPEHMKLQDYINDNLNVLCPIVGLEHVTEFLKNSEKISRPYYHCSLGGCCNEQGDSRQMFEHLTSLHHVITWLEENGHSVPELEAEIIQMCFKILKLNPSKKYRTMVNNELHRKCKKAGIRKTHIDKMNKEELKQRKEKRLSQSIEKDNDKLVEKISVEQPRPLSESQSVSSSTSLITDTTNSNLDNSGISEDKNAGIEETPMIKIKTESLDDVKQEKQLTSPFKNLVIKKENDPAVATGVPKTCPVVKVLTAKPKSPQIPPPQKQKLSLKDYQRREAEQVQIVGVRQGTVPRQRQVSSSQQNVKEESPPVDTDDDVVVTTPVLPPARPNVEKPPEPLDIRIRRVVKRILDDHYNFKGKYPNHLNGTPKVLKIRDDKHYTALCREYTERFQASVRDSYEAINGSLDDIDNADIKGYGFDVEIEKELDKLETLNN